MTTTKKHNVTASVETITPAMAAILLQTVGLNRKIRRGTVVRYIKDMKAGKWILNGETIIISSDGILLNGYHRCTAVLESGVSIEVVVVRGVDKDAYKSMDSGTNRTPADTLKAYGVTSYASEKANAVSSYLALINGKYICSAKGDTNLTASGMVGSRNMLVLDTYNENQELFDNVVKFTKNIKDQRKNLWSKIGLTPGDVSAITAKLHKDNGHSIEKTKNFFNELYQMDNTVTNVNPYITDLRKIMVNDYDSVNKFPPRVRQAYVAKTWKLYTGQIKSKSKKVTLTDEEIKNGVAFE